jgi:hypothetical protein
MFISYFSAPRCNARAFFASFDKVEIVLVGQRGNILSGTVFVIQNFVNLTIHQIHFVRLSLGSAHSG